MSGKRRATSDLNHDNWDREDEPEVAGTFQKASTDIMQRRVIRTAKRRTAGGQSPEPQESSKNAFSSFGGFTATDTMKLKASNDVKSMFSFLKNTPVTTNGKSETNISSPNASETQKTDDGKSTTLSDSPGRKKYPTKLIHLNREVANWIKSHIDKDPCCVLTPIFRDYEKYLKEIESDMDEKEEDKDSSKSSSLINFKFDSTQTKTVGSEKPLLFGSFKTDVKSPQGSTLLSKPDPASLMINPFTTKLNKSEEKNDSKEEVKAEIKPFSFGVNTQQPSTPATGFTFGSAKPFTFGNVASSAVNNNTEDKAEKETEESDEPPKPDFKPVQEEDAIYSKRCKVFIKKESGYADLGIGTLFVKPVTGEKHQLLVRADTSLGNILVNVLLTSAIPLQRMAKNNVMMICVPTPPAAGVASPAPSTVLLRVKTSDEADQLLANLEKYRK